MAIISVELSEENLSRLKVKAEKAGVAPEKLLAANLEEWLSDSESEFRAASAYVLKKNAELYKRLAG